MAEPNTHTPRRAHVSVVIPAYNHEAYLEQAIRSVWDQTYPEVEVVVVDDGSTDGTADVARRLAANAPRPTVFVSKSNEGLCATLNHAVALASGEWIAVLASDDFMASGRIAAQIAEADRLGDGYGFVHSDLLTVSRDGAPLYQVYDRSPVPPATGSCFEDLVMERVRIVLATALFRRDVFEEVGGFDESLAAEDFDFHLRMSKVTRCAFVAEPLTCKREVEGSLNTNVGAWGGDIITAVEKHERDLGALFPAALRFRYLRLVQACAVRGDYRLAARYLRDLVGRQEQPAERVSAAASGAAIVARAAGTRALRRALPASLFQTLRQAARKAPSRPH